MLNFAPNLRVRVGFYDIFIGEVFSNNIFFLRAFTQIPFFKEKNHNQNRHEYDA
jgi:hypothetical protein